MTKEQFFANFIPQFLASYVAVHYDNICTKGWYTYKPPTEDAVHLAEKIGKPSKKQTRR